MVMADYRNKELMYTRTTSTMSDSASDSASDSVSDSSTSSDSASNSVSSLNTITAELQLSLSYHLDRNNLVPKLNLLGKGMLLQLLGDTHLKYLPARLHPFLYFIRIAHAYHIRNEQEVAVSIHEVCHFVVA